MKYLLVVTILLILSGCSSQNGITPSQNKALNSISPSTAEKKEPGWIQRHLESWLQNDWEKRTQGFEENTSKEVATDAKKLPHNATKNNKKQKNGDDRFALQHYVDKIDYYIKHKPKSNTPSHAKELSKLPAIGCSNSR